MTRRQTQLELDATGYSIKVAAPMLDPDWTPARGYSHAANLVAILEQHDRDRAKVQAENPPKGGGERSGK